MTTFDAIHVKSSTMAYYQRSRFVSAILDCLNILINKMVFLSRKMRVTSVCWYNVKLNQIAVIFNNIFTFKYRLM